MSTLWTPGGEPGESEPGDLDGAVANSEANSGEGDQDAEQARAREELARIRGELLATPVRDIVANHAIGLWQLAVLHLGLDDENHSPDLPEAKLAIDALSSLVEGVIDRLDDHSEPLRSALTNIRLAYVAVSEDASAGA